MFLKFKNITAEFSGFKAVNQVNLSIQEKETRAIIGPNGAGKTTLIDMLTGKTKPTAGQILLHGEDITGKDASVISAKYKVGRKFQGPNVFDNVSVYENIEVALAGYSSLWQTFFFRQTSLIRERIENILETINLVDQKEMFPQYLSHGQRQWLEMGMVLAQDPEIITLDEPAAGMTDDETYKTGEMINCVMADKTVIVVEHDMDFIKQIAQTVTVLNQGQVLAEGTYDEVSKNPDVIRVYLKMDDKQGGDLS